MMSATGSGASQRRSTTRLPIPSLASASAARSDIRTPLPNVMIVRSSPEPITSTRARPIGTCAAAQSVGAG